MDLEKQLKKAVLEDSRDVPCGFTLCDFAKRIAMIGNSVAYSVECGSGTPTELGPLLRRAALIALVQAAKLEGDA